MDHYTYEILETGDIPENKDYVPTEYPLFQQYLDDNVIDFETFKNHFPEDKKIVKVKFRNIPRETPSHEKMLNWRLDNEDYNDKLTGAEINFWELDKGKPLPDIYDKITEDEREETLPQSELVKRGAKEHIVVDEESGVVDKKDGAVAGGNHKSRRNRKRKNIKKSKKNYKGGHKIKKNRSKRIKARISRSL
jgi:hypothetical protein